MSHLDLQEILSCPIHKQDIQDIASKLSTSSGLNSLKEIFLLVFHQDKRISDNATWVLTHADKDCQKWLSKKQDQLIDEAIDTTSITKRRLILTILNRQSLSKDNIRTDFLDFCLQQIQISTLPAGLRSVCVKLAYKQCRFYPELTEELHRTLKILTREQLSPAMKLTIKHISSQITLQKESAKTRS